MGGCESTRMGASMPCSQQLDALLDRRDGELVDACLKRRAGYMHGTVPVAVRLDDCHDLAVEPDALANDTDVVRDRVQVDLDPRPTRDVLTGIAFLELELIAIDMLMLVHRIFAERTAHAGMRPKIVDLVRAHELSSASRSRRTEPILQIISSGITAWTLNSHAAALPARPWTDTASVAASSASSPCARKDATMPAEHVTRPGLGKLGAAFGDGAQFAKRRRDQASRGP